MYDGTQFISGGEYDYIYIDNEWPPPSYDEFHSAADDRFVEFISRLNHEIEKKAKIERMARLASSLFKPKFRLPDV